MDAPPHIQRVLDRLDGVAPNGAGWQARCPAHHDENPSLSIALGDDGRVLVSCHAGCEFSSIVKAIGLEPRDFFAPTANANGRTNTQGRSPRVFPTLEGAIAAACPRGNKFVASWPYKTANGEVLFYVCRFEPIKPPPDGAKPDKTFRPISHVD